MKMHFVLFLCFGFYSTTANGRELHNPSLDTRNANDNLLFGILVRQMDTMDKKLLNLEQVLKNEQVKSNKFEKELKTLKNAREVKGPVVFARYRYVRYKALGKNEILRFDDVLLNRQRGYNPHTGYFTVPISGIYYISFVGRSASGKHLHVWLTVNNKNIAISYAGNHKTGTLNATVNLKKGDSVALRHDGASYVENEQIQTGASSMYSIIYISK